MPSDNLCNFHTLYLNNLTNPSADVSSIIITKCVIFDNLLHTTKITSFHATNGNFMIKSTIRCIYGFSGISLNFNFLTDVFI